MKKSLLITILVAFIVGGLGAYVFAPKSGAITQKESAYERVIKSKEIRCGYTPYSVGLKKDPNTGALSGIYKDTIEEVGKLLDVKIKWTEEVGWGQQIEGLQAGRYDMICSPVSMTGPRTVAADFSQPLYYSPVWIWVKSSDTRFDNQSRDALNNSNIKIATLDGEQTDTMARNNFPKANRVSLPQSSDFASLLQTVIAEKADLTFAEPFSVYEFMATNPDTLKTIAGDQPLNLVPNIFLLPSGEPQFKSMINNALTQLFLNGFINKAIDHYETYKNSYVRSKGYN